MSNQPTFQPYDQKPIVDMEIDYSATISEVQNPLTDWEPPPHVYYGKRLPNGKSEKEPVYVHQEYPRMLYKPVNGKLRAIVVNSDEEKKARLDDGYGLTPADFGVETCPARPDVVARQVEREAEEPVIETETVEVVKRRGRPRKDAPGA